jgi:hypothetical protein
VHTIPSSQSRHSMLESQFGVVYHIVVQASRRRVLLYSVTVTVTVYSKDQIQFDLSSKHVFERVYRKLSVCFGLCVPCVVDLFSAIGVISCGHQKVLRKRPLLRILVISFSHQSITTCFKSAVVSAQRLLLAFNLSGKSQIWSRSRYMAWDTHDTMAA